MRYKVLAKDATITLTIRIYSGFASCTIPFTQAEFCSSSHVASLLIQKIYLTLYRWILLIVHSFYIFTRKVLLGDFVQPSTISLHIRFRYFTWTTGYMLSFVKIGITSAIRSLFVSFIYTYFYLFGLHFVHK